MYRTHLLDNTEMLRRRKFLQDTDKIRTDSRKIAIGNAGLGLFRTELLMLKPTWRH